MESDGKASVMEEIASISGQVNSMKTKCQKLRSLLDEGTYKLEAVLNIVDNMKNREHTIMTASDNQEAASQITEEQVDSMLEMLKSPAFQSLAKQVITGWVNKSSAKGEADVNTAKE